MKYEVGMIVFIIHIVDDSEDYFGRVGVIEHIDDIGQLHGSWGGLALITNVDEFVVVGDLYAQKL